MDKLLAVLGILVSAAFLITIDSYLRQDKQIEKARTCIRNMSPDLDEWLTVAGKMLDSTCGGDLSGEYDGLMREISENSSYKTLFRKVPAVNRIREILMETVEKNSGNAAFQDLRQELAYYALRLDYKRTEYNKCVLKLQKTGSTRVGRFASGLFRLPELTILHDFEV